MFVAILPTVDPYEETLVEHMMNKGIRRKRVPMSYGPPFEEYAYFCWDKEDLVRFVAGHWGDDELSTVEEVK